MTKFNFSNVQISMSANCKGSVYNVWGDKMTHYKFIVTIRTANGKGTFSFYDSFANYQKGITELDADELQNALDCYLSDAMAYENTQSFDEFCNEFGYDPYEDTQRAKKAFNGCKRQYTNAIRLFGDVDTICNVLNAMHE